MTPMMSTWLIEATGNKAAIGYWLSFAGACGLIATLVVYRGGGAIDQGRQRLLDQG